MNCPGSEPGECWCPYIASVFLIGEARDATERKQFVRRFFIFMTLTVLIGGAVMGVAFLEEIGLIESYLESPISLLCVLVATVLIPLLLLAVLREWDWTARLLVGGQATCILLAWFAAQYPVILMFRDGTGLTLHEAAAPPATLRGLVIALVVGAFLVGPAMGYMFWILKIRGEK